jgi:hypothetical protein
MTPIPRQGLKQGMGNPPRGTLDIRRGGRKGQAGNGEPLPSLRDVKGGQGTR